MRRNKPRPDPTPHPATIDNLSHDGRGIARIDGKVTFIQGALPQEDVEFKYTRVKKDFSEGQILTVLKASPLRVEPKCPHYQMCGGCSLQHMNESEQIHYKEEQLLDLITRFGHTYPETILPPLSATHWNYRNKARLSVRFVEKKQASLVGFRERNNPRYITEITMCPVLNAKVDADITHLRQLIDTMTDKHCIAQIEVAAGDDEIALIFRNLTPLSSEDELRLQTFGQLHNYKIFLQPSGPDSVYCFYPLSADPYLTYSLPDYSLTFKFHPNDFTQVNAALNRLMINRALELLDLKETDSVLDLFCGLGNFSLPLAKFCANVVGIEGSKEMVERAHMNATLNHITNVQFYAANLDDAEAVRKVANRSFNKVLIDPPRSGALELVKQIDAIAPECIVYVSCNPVTLEQNLQQLSKTHKGIN